MSNSSNKSPELTPSVRREEFIRNPGDTVRQAIATGRVVITDPQGKPLGVISAPMDRRSVPTD